MPLFHFQPWLDTDALEACAAAATQKGCPIPNIVGLVDGTTVEICRPIRNQQAYYNGKDRIHCLKYQYLTMMNGIINHMHGPLLGPVHDSPMFDDSGVEQQLRGLTAHDGSQFILYADKAYRLSDLVVTPFRTIGHQPLQQQFNRVMSSIRIPNEWSVGMTEGLFKFNTYPKNLKVLLSPIGVYYLVSTILTNCHTCLHGNEISKYFDLAPPSIEEYLQ